MEQQGGGGQDPQVAVAPVAVAAAAAPGVLPAASSGVTTASNGSVVAAVKSKPAPKKPRAPRSKAKSDKPAGTSQPKKVAAPKKKATPKAASKKKKTEEAGAAGGVPPANVGSGGQFNGGGNAVDLGKLRQMFLQQMYHQLQASRPDQDPAAVGRIATHVEMEAYQKSTTPDEYANAMNTELAKLMAINRSRAAGAQQPHMAAHPASTAAMTSLAMNGGPPTSSSVAASNGMQQQSYSQSVGVPGHHAQAPGYPTGAAGMPVARMPAAAMNGRGPGLESAVPPNMSRLPDHLKSAAAPLRQPLQMYPGGKHQMQQPPTEQHMPPHHSLEAFAQQVEHFDKKALIEFAWNLRSALGQWQSRASQLEQQVMALHNALAMNGQRAPPQNSVAHQQGEPAMNWRDASREAMRNEAMRNEAMRNEAMRNEAMRNEATSAQTSQPGSSEHYWSRVGVMRGMYLRDLHLAHQALGNHHAPADSAQGVKVENLRHNVELALNVLNEPPNLAQPKSVDVLNSIERFMQNTVAPIIQRIQDRAPPAAAPPVTAGPPTTRPMGPSAIPTPPRSAPQHHTVQPSPAAFVPSSSVDHRTSTVVATSNGVRTSTPSRPVDARAPRKQPATVPTSSAGRVLDGLESPFGVVVGAKMALPTFSPSERRSAVGQHVNDAKATKPSDGPVSEGKASDGLQVFVDENVENGRPANRETGSNAKKPADSM